MSHYPFRALGDSADLNYATIVVDHRLTHYIFLAGLAVLVYDHLLTLEAEIKLIWSSKLRASTCWFLAVRYIALSANIGVVVYYFGNLDHEEAFIETTLSLRVFAMYGLNRWVLACLLSATCVIASLGLWASITYAQHTEIPDIPGLVGCHVINRTAAAHRWAGTWEAILVCDIVVFALTVRRAYLRRKTPLYQRMATDGSMYFGLIVLANLANVLTFYLGDGLIAGFLSWFTTSLSVTLVSRLMLNLHEAAVPRVATNPVYTGTLRFIEMGNTSIGGTLDMEMIQFTEMGSTPIDDESRNRTQASLAM
ncbi:hypothetical protein B0H14DRAFT_3898640 [Mycena olivaceomarginata]|nr:hypothetical protein B0H14DRAFT_3898640 [Mycena olivaceomarginata]